ncbi:hypothetical protein THF1C08_140096 [Vibrio jasicida]|uniref:Uncharacterized protein n=1 Tax=Vibrio jasicida TaxID=766224 RepID=A0AAU9QGT0_9VIBR|nr:hypothetical protein THF1C08_140096 [Vibrio jasicida]CAH1575427.1 hypothetical protein THF1A12_130096 [Vibrio jasicida]
MTVLLNTETKPHNVNNNYLGRINYDKKTSQDFYKVSEDVKGYVCNAP